MDEAVELTNATRFGLGSTVFSKARGPELAARIRSGMTAINGVITFAAIPSLPFGGVGDSGFGRVHGADGLKEFTYPKAVARQRFKPAAGAHVVHPHREGRAAARPADHDAARARHHDRAESGRPVRRRRGRERRREG